MIRRKGGVIKIGVINGNQAGNLDAHKPIGMSSVFRGWPLYAKLWEWGRDIQPKLALAEFAEPNNDGTKWTIRLKKDSNFTTVKPLQLMMLFFFTPFDRPKTCLAIRSLSLFFAKRCN